MFIKLEPIKQIKRFVSCLFYLNSSTNTSSIKTKGFKQLKTNALLLRRHHYLQRSNQVIEKFSKITKLMLKVSGSQMLRSTLLSA